MCEFLELSGQSAFVGAFDSSQQALNVALDATVVAVAEEQRAELAEGMAPRQVTVELHSPMQSVNIQESPKCHKDKDKNS